MNKLRLEKIILLVAFLFVWSSILLTQKSPFPGEMADENDTITIAVLHPSMGSIKALITLREKGLIPLPHLRVLGVYHEEQLTDYGKAKEFVTANNLEWFSFYPISGPLSEDTLFQRNPCSTEFERIFEETDGLIFFGGPDIPPRLYHEKTNLLTKIDDPYRHFLELSFIFHLLGGFQDETFPPLLDRQPEFPVLGICLGSQSLNVGTGGTLTQDIWSEIYGVNQVEAAIELGKEFWHSNPFSLLAPQEKFYSYMIHPIKLEAKGKLCSVLGFKPEDTPVVISEHHQEVKNLGKGFRVIASSLDGKVDEAIEHERYPNVLGVQFHPEYPDLYTDEARLRFTPQDKDPVNITSFLEAHPPSADFHKKLWAWVSQSWEENHKRRLSR
ncbi:MAG: gamma-glutamyl-gamma-aminobutyrate hydrolase family protein [Clostridiales bacterium]|nr:gamma-glutamyl-gamma-aminobutyrate hydrolase family protein [Clostridiales bacterium]